MTFDRAKIFRKAWEIARRLAAAMKVPVRSHLARGLRDAWWHARVDAETARIIAANKARREGKVQVPDVLTPGLREALNRAGGMKLTLITPSIRPERMLVRGSRWR